MHEFIRNALVHIINKHKDLVKIPIRQRAKFEGWLKFELANYLEHNGMELVEVESQGYYKTDRTDITFEYQGYMYSIELKTPNTNWKIEGISSKDRPITKNIDSIIYDTKKLNSKYGIVAFILFPVPIRDSRWKAYLDRISKATGISLSIEDNCSIVQIELDNNHSCDIVVCTYMSKYYGVR